MANVFFIGDTHFGHVLIASIRGFSSIEEHDETLIENWNKVVRQKDVIYHLGDVCFGKPELLSRLKGYKKLILGNHDNERKLSSYFDRFYGATSIHGWILTHIPVHYHQFQRYEYNIHGHLHSHQLGSQYINVCVEQTKLTPIAIEEILQRIKS